MPALVLSFPAGPKRLQNPTHSSFKFILQLARTPLWRIRINKTIRGRQTHKMSSVFHLQSIIHLARSVAFPALGSNDKATAPLTFALSVEGSV